MTSAELTTILQDHYDWLTDLRGTRGKRADFAGADLQGADLQGADLEKADLAWANLTDADSDGPTSRKLISAG